MLNILGISRFLVLASYTPGVDGTEGVWAWGQWGKISFALAVGVLPYPLTFLCTDLISEFYGRKRANFLVLVGLLVNLWVLLIMWLGGLLPPIAEFVSYGTNAMGQEIFAPPLPEAVYDEAGHFVRFNEDWTFYRIQMLTLGAVAASMIAYLAAQFVDVQVFHFWKRMTKGKHLWLRNNGSTIISQFVDTFAVITITYFYANALPVAAGEPIWPQLWMFIATGFVFKLVVALLDTPLIYLAVAVLRKYLHIDPTAEHNADAEEIQLFSQTEQG